MVQTKTSVLRPMDLVFYTEHENFWTGKANKMGFVVMIFEDMFVVEVGKSELKLRHIEELDIEEARRSWFYDTNNATYTAQSILLNDLGREMTGSNDSQYQVAKNMQHKDLPSHYACLVMMLTGVPFVKGSTLNVKRKDFLSPKMGLQKINLLEK